MTASAQAAQKRKESAEARKMARVLLDMGEVDQALNTVFYAGLLEGDAQMIEALEKEKARRNV